MSRGTRKRPLRRKDAWDMNEWQRDLITTNLCPRDVVVLFGITSRLTPHIHGFHDPWSRGLVHPSVSGVVPRKGAELCLCRPATSFWSFLRRWVRNARQLADTLVSSLAEVEADVDVEVGKRCHEGLEFEAKV